MRIAFVHIPRTAGTAFGRFLQQCCPEARVRDFYAEKTGTAQSAIDEFRLLSVAEKQSYHLLKGHFVFGFDPDLQDAHYLVFLRRPMERLISYYFYALADARNYLHRLLVQRRMRLEEFLLSDISIELDNYQVRAVSGVGTEVPRGEIGPEHLTQAKRNLQTRFAAFGLTEKYQESIAEISRVLGWETPRAVAAQAPSGRRPMAALSDRCRQAFEARNQYDSALYDFAEALFVERTGRSGEVARDRHRMQQGRR